ncbi:4-(cytidine 5'-diphospho)-2-C-methyl-D-erythritol kinase [Saccharibacter sp. 17.LH.SD]|uniref:4-(cytidine 5'-diphospho)-2-C-methyl-D-erythritol kinase n=1 Tax=Saccharibacter sp. 17.LH.SD TaxID=2689393 RepID=UPI00136A060E|nr:4-(cytidine 5'-diphospho)-2-C-methyl-D-erythritol kinase [Saccharibacter sp. 17.LH.SD]MXV44889.1 4-(cytidine 5'-diphospho)-2-C-methyl-D-erythritol kinase [Saccharibacter sp. 17.LH.SD]
MPLLHDEAHAKINLFLHVTGRRDDGYHLLDSLAVFAGAADHLSLKRTHPVDSDIATLSIDGRFAAGLQSNKDNLITQAARLLHEAAIREGQNASSLLPVHFQLTKELPVASGIGGGSADAACALRLLCRYWQIPFEIAIQQAPQLGADVPVCLKQRPKRMEGIGDILTPAPPLPNMGMLLVNPGVSVSTPSIFKRLAQTTGLQERSTLSFPKEGWNSLHALISFLRETANDLQPHAIVQEPIIQTVLDLLETLPNARFARMSGSGATCFALFETPDDALAAQKTLSHTTQSHNWWHWAGAV